MHPNTRTRLVRHLGQNPTKEAERLLRRIGCQIDYAAGLAAWRGTGAEAVAKARAIVDSVDASKGLAGLAQAVGEAEQALMPLRELAKSLTVHLVGHGHIDMNWMWSYPETCATTHDTFASVLSLMEQYPELTYSQSQASVYEIVERLHPEMFEQIRRRVKEGRWEVTACHWVEGDKNIVNGESLARHLLYTRDYFGEKFDLRPEDVEVDWEPDTFGHANTMPTILAQGGVKYYYACRTGGGHHHERVGEERPPIFWWQGPDGARILVNRETTWYNSYVNIGDNYALPALEFCKTTGLSDWLDIYGIGNHGGGPTRTELDYFLESRDWPIWPTVEFSTAHKWFRKVESACGSLPVIDHELNYEFTGCYTSQSAIKRANRFGENLCLEAETLAVMAGPTGAAKDAHGRASRASAWKNVLFNQFHDILPGSGVAATREHALGLFQETAAIVGAMKRNAIKSLVADIDTASLLPDDPDGQEERELLADGAANAPYFAGAGQGAGMSGFSRATGGGKRFLPVVVFNPCAWTRSEIVEAHLYDTELVAGRLVARDESGKCFPTFTTADRVWDWDHKRTSVLFPAVDIPPLGYKTFLICEGVADADVPGVEVLDETVFKTPTATIELDRYRAGLKAVRLVNGAEITSGIEPFGNWELTHETPRGMTSWVLGEETADSEALVADSYRFRAPARNEGNSSVAGTAEVLRSEHTIRVPNTDSRIKVTTTVSGLQPRVDFEAEIDWREIGTPESGIPGLRVDFESNLFNGKSLFETPFGSVARPDEPREVPTLRYVHRFGKEASGDCGFTVLQDSKPGHACDGANVAMRVVRSSYDPDHAPEVGKQTVRYSVVFHEETPSPAELTRLGAAWNHPLIVVSALLQEGNVPTSMSFGEVLSPSVVLTSLKAAEDGRGIIARLVEYDGEDVEAAVRLSAGAKKASLCDLMERPVQGNVKLEGDTLRVSIRANSFVSVRLEP